MNIKTKLTNDRFVLRMLVVTSVLMLASLFFGYKIAAIGLTIYIANVFWVMYMLFSGTGFTVGKFAEAVDDKFEDARDNSNYIQAGVYAVTIPMMALGLIVIVGTLIAMFFFME